MVISISNPNVRSHTHGVGRAGRASAETSLQDFPPRALRGFRRFFEVNTNAGELVVLHKRGQRVDEILTVWFVGDRARE